MDNIKIPHVFITYSWSSLSHEKWVERLYRRLQSDGVRVSFDKTDLELGTDKLAFMESMVSSEDIDRVIIVVDKLYAEKADEKKGGVGTETQIISPEIYKSVSENKFIPLLLNRDEKGNAILPIYLRSRMYIDFSDSERFEKSYDELLRELYGQQEIKKAPLGKPPAYLFLQSKISNELRYINYEIDSGNQLKIRSKIRDFFNHYYEDLLKFKISVGNERDPLVRSKMVFESINSMLEIKDQFINFCDGVLKMNQNLLMDPLLDFFEKLPKLTELTSREVNTNIDNDNFKFVIHEIFLCVISLYLKHEQYSSVRQILKSNFQFKDSYKVDFFRFDKFYFYINSIEKYYSSFAGIDHRNSMGHLIIKRLSERIDIQTLKNADAFCYYFVTLENLDIDDKNEQLEWYPITFHGPFDKKCTLFERMPLKRSFNKLKHLFGVEDPDDLRLLIQKYKSKVPRLSRHQSNLALLHDIIDLDKIGSLD